jgi:hypothetical protein
MSVMRLRRIRNAAGVFALVAMLFAQAAFALAACDPARAQSRALMIAAHQTQIQAAPCHQPAENAYLCLTHCQSGEQTLDKNQVKVPEGSLQPVFVVRVRQQTRLPASSAPRTPCAFAAPPPRILFRSLLI